MDARKITHPPQPPHKSNRSPPCHTSTLTLMWLAPYAFLAVELVTALGTTPQTMPEFGIWRFERKFNCQKNVYTSSYYLKGCRPRKCLVDFIRKSHLFPGLRHLLRQSCALTEVERNGLVILHLVCYRWRTPTKSGTAQSINVGKVNCSLG